MSNILEARHIYKQYNDSDGYVLNDLSLSLKKGEIVALVGASGTGKSTLLHILGLLDKPTKGDVLFRGIDTNLLDHPSTICHNFGFVYQFHNLLPEFTAEENIVLPQLIAGTLKKEASKRALELLDLFKLANKAKSFPSELSGGQKQRVAIARALANTPDILLADEPTGSLDEKNAAIVTNEMLNILRKFNLSAIIATHNIELANQLDRRITLS